MMKKKFFDNLEVKKYGIANSVYFIDFQWLKPGDALSANIQKKKD